MSNTDFVYNRVERIMRMKDELQSKMWDLEDLNQEIKRLTQRINELELKEAERGV